MNTLINHIIIKNEEVSLSHNPESQDFERLSNGVSCGSRVAASIGSTYIPAGRNLKIRVSVCSL